MRRDYAYSRQVTPAQLQAIKYGDWMLDIAKGYFPRGAANNHIHSDTEPCPFIYQLWVIGHEEVLDPKGKKLAAIDMSKRNGRVARALSAGTGNCGQMSEFVAMLCVDYFPSNATIYIVSLPNREHDWVRIKGPGYDIAVDLWPTDCQTVLYEDHFRSNQGEQQMTISRGQVEAVQSGSAQSMLSGTQQPMKIHTLLGGPKTYNLDCPMPKKELVRYCCRGGEGLIKYCS